MMFCSNCGFALSSQAKFCYKCGISVSARAKYPSRSIAPEKSASSNLPASTSFQDPTTLTEWLTYSLYAFILIEALGAFFLVHEYRLLSNMQSGWNSYGVFDELKGNNQIQKIINTFDICLGLATNLLFLIWVHRANFNSHQLGAQDMKFSPGWAVAYYFIPILWFWKPYQAMKEIWLTSKAPQAWQSIASGTIVPWWWFFFLLSLALNKAGFVSVQASSYLINTYGMLDQDVLSQAIRATGLMSAALLTSILSTMIAILLVREIYDMQISQRKMQE